MYVHVHIHTCNKAHNKIVLHLHTHTDTHKLVYTHSTWRNTQRDHTRVYWIFPPTLSLKISLKGSVGAVTASSASVAFAPRTPVPHTPAPRTPSHVRVDIYMNDNKHTHDWVHKDQRNAWMHISWKHLLFLCVYACVQHINMRRIFT